MNSSTCQGISSQTERWFDDFIAQLRSDQIQLDTSIASKEKQKFYDLMMTENQDEILMFGRNMSSMYFIRRMIMEYVDELQAMKCQPLRLSLNHSNSKILVWAEIDNNDEPTEDKLLIAEAKINAKYHNKGFYISSTIVEKCDSFPIPSQYQPLLST